MDDETQKHLDRLLAAGNVSGPEADAILARVLAKVDRDERRHLPRTVTIIASGVAAAAALMVFVWPGTGNHGKLVARGPEPANIPVLSVTCTDGELSACPVSGTLAFSVSGDGAAGVLSAYAEPIDGAAVGAGNVWYFSSETGAPELIASGDGTRVFERGVRLSRAHRAGRYRVRAFLAQRPLDRDEMLAVPDDTTVRASLQTELTVVE